MTIGLIQNSHFERATKFSNLRTKVDKTGTDYKEFCCMGDLCKMALFQQIEEKLLWARTSCLSVTRKLLRNL